MQLTLNDPKHVSGKYPVIYHDGTQLVAVDVHDTPFTGGTTFGAAFVLDLGHPIEGISAAPSKKGVWVRLEGPHMVPVAFANNITIA